MFQLARGGDGEAIANANASSAGNVLVSAYSRGSTGAQAGDGVGTARGAANIGTVQATGENSLQTPGSLRRLNATAASEFSGAGAARAIVTQTHQRAADADTTLSADVFGMALPDPVTVMSILGDNLLLSQALDNAHAEAPFAYASADLRHPG